MEWGWGGGWGGVGGGGGGGGGGNADCFCFVFLVFLGQGYFPFQSKASFFSLQSEIAAAMSFIESSDFSFSKSKITVRLLLRFFSTFIPPSMILCGTLLSCVCPYKSFFATYPLFAYVNDVVVF